MGPKNDFTRYEEDLCCPVCKHPLSCPGTPPKHKFFHRSSRGKGRPPHIQSHLQARKEARIAIEKSSTKDNTEVVVAQCGHLFHKFCLRHYCYLFREGKPDTTSPVTCPVCKRKISMSSTQTIFYRSHQDHLTDSDKEAAKIIVMNNELSGQLKTAKSKLKQLKESTDLESRNLDIYSAHWKQLKKDIKNVKGRKGDIERMYEEIQRTDKMLTFMQTQHLKIVRKFITKVKTKDPQEYIHFPTRLAPYLDIVEKDDRLVRDLGEVIMPIHLNHLKSDRFSLLKGIIETAQEKMHGIKLKKEEEEEEESNKSTAAAKKEKKLQDEQEMKNPFRNFPASQRPPIFVKVRKSSVSILSSTSLTKESIHKIMQTVKGPIQALKTNGMLKQKNKFSDNRVDNVSASDIKIIYMPKRKMVEPVSEPCRAIDPSDSFAIKIPSRRCRSTDAVLMRQKKRKTRSTPRGSIQEQEQEALKAERAEVNLKRSKSAEVITSGFPTLSLNTSNSNTPRKSEQRAPKKASALIAIVNLPEDIRSDTVEELKESVCKKESRGDQDMPSSNPISGYRKNENNNLQVAKREGDVNNNFEEQTRLDEKLSSEDLREKASVLQLIYKDLEEERKSNFHFEKMSSWKCASSEDLKEENKDHSKTPRKEATPEVNSSTCEEIGFRPPPQFFRVDRRGNIRPESPYRMCFRQPTFLSSFTDIMNERTCFMAGCAEPDEENQLDALSPEDRYLLAAEQEAIMSGKGTKRNVILGLPACLGVPPSNSDVDGSGSHTVPVYLRRWQQQLPSRKIFESDSSQRSFTPTTPVAQCFSARVEPKRNFVTHFKQRSRLGTHQQKVGLPSGRKPRKSEGVRLPPLYMFPAKRPSTADCAGTMESVPLKRLELETLPRVYNFTNRNPFQSTAK